MWNSHSRSTVLMVCDSTHVIWSVSIVILSHLRSLNAPQTGPLCHPFFKMYIFLVYLYTRPVGVKNKILFYSILNRTQIWVRHSICK